jgi:hypothetical protein
MNKQAISITLSPENLLWLRARTIATKARSLSEAMDRLIAEARAARDSVAPEARSVVGMVRIPEDDPDLRKADAEIRRLFDESLFRRTSGDPSRAPRKRKRK